MGPYLISCLIIASILGLHSVVAQSNFTKVQLIERPRNTAVLRGSKAVLNCTFKVSGGDEDVVEWNLINTAQSSSIRISYNDDIGDHEEIVDRGGRLKYSVQLSTEDALRGFDLHLNQTAAVDSRYLYYECRALRSDVRGTAQILVVDDLPFCGLSPELHQSHHVITIVENDMINVTCQANYTARWSPSVTWYGIQDGDEQKYFNVTTEGEMSHSLLTGPLNYSYDGQTVTCKVNFTEPPVWAVSPQEEYDRSPPELNEYCRVTLNILHNVTNVHVKPDPSSGNLTLVVNDSLTCSAGGNPSPDILWAKRDGTGDGELHNETLVITEQMAGYSHMYTCTATNEVLNVSNSISLEVLFYVEPLPTESVTQVTELFPTSTEQSHLSQVNQESSSMLPLHTTEAATPVFPPDVTSGSLPPWAIVLIVVAALVVILLIVLLVVFKVYRKTTRQKTAHINTAQKVEEEKSKPVQFTPDYIPHATYGKEFVEQERNGEFVNPGYVEERDDERNGTENGQAGMVYGEIQSEALSNEDQPSLTSEMENQSNVTIGADYILQQPNEMPAGVWNIPSQGFTVTIIEDDDKSANKLHA